MCSHSATVFSFRHLILQANCLPAALGPPCAWRASQVQLHLQHCGRMRRLYQDHGRGLAPYVCTLREAAVGLYTVHTLASCFLSFFASLFLYFFGFFSEQRSPVVLLLSLDYLCLLSLSFFYLFLVSRSLLPCFFPYRLVDLPLSAASLLRCLKRVSLALARAPSSTFYQFIEHCTSCCCSTTRTDTRTP